MSSDNSSEEKTLPASQRKLQELRKKGQVANSQDFVNALVVIGVIVYLWSQWGTTEQRLERILALPSQIAPAEFAARAQLLTAALLREAGIVLIPVIVIGLAGAILGNFIVKRGPVISIEPVKPRMDRLNPVSGLKLLFSLRSLVNFIKSLMKLILLLTALSVVILLGLNSLMNAPACGPGCLSGVAGDLFKRLAAVAAILYLVSGLVDILLQRWLFLRDMRMTKTELKREMKEQEGDPLFRRLRRQRRQEALASTTRLGAERATFFLCTPGRIAFGLRYRRGETPVPVVVCKAVDTAADQMLGAARRRGVPIEINETLEARLGNRLSVGEVVPESLYDMIADIMVRHKIA